MYSLTITGIITAAVLPLLAQWGFTGACSQEILGIGLPYFLTIPGLVMAWIGRVRVGDIHPGGVRK